MSDSEDAQTPIMPADGDEASADHPIEDSDAAQSQTDENMKNGIEADNDAADEPAADEDENMDDLFGEDGDDDDVAPSRKRRLDDEELDSGDDMGRNDRTIEDDQPGTPEPEQQLTEAEISLGRHPVLKGSDGEVYLLHHAAYTGMDAKVFDPSTFTIPTTGHHSNGPPAENFSAAQTAASTIRWRPNPKEPSRMQSNARVIRWSDGSLTMQVGSNATEQYELPANAFAPPQRNPKKPTPVSKIIKGAQPPVSKKQEASVYLASLDEESNFARITNHVTAYLSVRSSKMTASDDAAILKLQQATSAMSEARSGSKTAVGGMELTTKVEDPDLLRKRAEQAEKEKAKMEKSMQARRDREQARRQGVMGRSAGLGRSSGMGLSIAGLEEEGLGGYGAARKRAPPKKKSRPNDYSDDEDSLGRGNTREDDYEKGDGFIVSSGDEEIVDSGDDDEEEELEEDAEGEEDDAPVQQSVEANDEPGSRRRGGKQVVDDDDDE